mgnify:CR=1 FL=1
MKILLNLIGFLLSMCTVAVIGETTVVWRGILRGGLALLLVGFTLICVGFLWNIFAALYHLPELDIVLFAVGIAFLLIGVKRIFTFTQRPQI